MIMSMVDVDAKKRSILFVVIEKDNLERMEQADPITIESIKEGGILPVIKYPQNFSILIAYEPDSEELYRQGKRGGLSLLGWLERGRKFIKGLDGKDNTFKMPKEPEKISPGERDLEGELKLAYREIERHGKMIDLIYMDADGENPHPRTWKAEAQELREKLDALEKEPS